MQVVFLGGGPKEDEGIMGEDREVPKVSSVSSSSLPLWATEGQPCWVPLDQRVEYAQVIPDEE